MVRSVPNGKSFVEHLARELTGKIKLVKINVDESPKVAGQFRVQAIPTLMVIWGEKVLSRQTGAAPERQLKRGWRRR